MFEILRRIFNPFEPYERLQKIADEEPEFSASGEPLLPHDRVEVGHLSPRYRVPRNWNGRLDWPAGHYGGFLVKEDKPNNGRPPPPPRRR